MADQVLGDLPSQMKISQIPTLRAHIWQTRSWQIFHRPPKQWFHRFLLWEFIFGRPGLGRSTTLKWQFHRFLLWEVIFGRSGLDISTPITPQWFHRFLLWELIFGRLGLGRSTPLKWQFHRFLLLELIFGRPGLGISSITPPSSDFKDSYSEGSYMAGQFLADLPLPLSANLTDSYSESSYLDNQVLVDPPPFSLPVSNDNFTDSYSGSSYLADQVSGDLSSQMAISQIPDLRA